MTFSGVRRSGAVVCGLLIVALVSPPPGLLAQEQAPRVLRTTSTLVPLDVRVVDRQGRPVTDLRESDFEIREDGVVQRIAHFSAESLERVADLANDGPLNRALPANQLLRPKRRVILLVMGRGTLEHPFNAVQASIDFVRTKLMPQDYVAVMAYNRATEFTTDHKKVVGVLERFNEKHENIDRRFDISIGGLALLYGNRRIPDSIQKDIDWIFAAAGGDVRVASREPEAVNPKARREVFGDMEELLYDLKHSGAAPVSPRFDRFVAWIMPTMHDAGSIHAGIEYLRFIEGEKRLIFVTEHGFSLPRTESDLRIAEVASEARIVIDTIQAGGVVARTPADGDGEWSTEMFRRMSAMATIKILTDQTGGQRFTNVRPHEAFDRIDQSSRFQYVLAYYPQTDKKDGRFRKIDVTVKRPDTSIQVRRGYYATDTPPTLDRARIMAESRMLTALAIGERLTDIPVAVNVAISRGSNGQWTSTVSGRIDARRLGWMSSEDGRFRLSLELAIVCVDSKGLLVGEHRQPLMVTVAKDAYEKALSSGLNFSVAVAATGLPTDVKVVAYDPARDLLGSEVWRSGTMR